MRLERSSAGAMYRFFDVSRNELPPGIDLNHAKRDVYATSTGVLYKGEEVVLLVMKNYRFSYLFGAIGFYQPFRLVARFLYLTLANNRRFFGRFI